MGSFRPRHPLAADGALLLPLEDAAPPLVAAASTPVAPDSLAADASEGTIDAGAAGLALLRASAATGCRIAELTPLDPPVSDR